MTRSKSAWALLVAAGATLAAWAPAALADAPRKIEFLPQSKVWLEGDSTLHSYQSSAKQWQAKAVLASLKADSARLTDFEFVVPVRALKSKDSALDDNMYKALQADRFSTIRFSANAVKVRISNTGAVDATADGRLSIAGTERPATVRVDGQKIGDTLQLKGSKELTMSEFGIQPPVLLGGVIKCSDRIVVRYELVAKLTD